MKTEREVGMLNLRPYGKYLPGVTYETLRKHFREVVIEVGPENCHFPYVMSDVFGNLYGYRYEDALNRGKCGLFLVRLDEGAATIVEEI